MSRIYRLGSVRRTNWELIFLVCNAMWAAVAILCLYSCQAERRQSERHAQQAIAEAQKSTAESLRQLYGAR